MKNVSFYGSDQSRGIFGFDVNTHLDDQVPLGVSGHSAELGGQLLKLGPAVCVNHPAWRRGAAEEEPVREVNTTRAQTKLSSSHHGGCEPIITRSALQTVVNHQHHSQQRQLPPHTHTLPVRLRSVRFICSTPSPRQHITEMSCNYCGNQTRFHLYWCGGEAAAGHAV